MKNFILGVDCADWRIINKLLSNNELPTFRKLLSESSYGKSRSYIDYGSPALWATIDTGKIPPKHGVSDFFTTTRNHVISKRIFEILEGNAGKLGLMKWYCTWPIIINEGFTIPSWLTRKYEAYPSEYSFITYLGKSMSLYHQIRIGLTCLKYGIRLSTLLYAISEAISRKIKKKDNLDKIIIDNTLAFKFQAEVYMHLLKKKEPNYSAFLISIIDSLGHRFWKYLEPELYENLTDKEIKKYNQVIYDSYRLVDNYLGKIIKLIDNIYGNENVNLMVVSDHGMKGVRETENWGYHPRTLSLLEKLNLSDKVTATNIGNYIYIRSKRSDLSCKELQKRFDSIKTTKGKKVFFITPKENGNLLELLIDRTISIEEDVTENSGAVFKMSDFVSPADSISGDHAEHGIYIFRSKLVKRNNKIEKIYGLEDLAPTILHLNGKEIGKDMDGRPIEEIYTEEFKSGNPIKYIDSYDDTSSDNEAHIDSDKETEEIKEKLQQLGYLS